MFSSKHVCKLALALDLGLVVAVGEHKPGVNGLERNSMYFAFRRLAAKYRLELHSISLVCCN